MRALRFSILMMACCTLTGCFQLEGVHVLHYLGEKDSGSYRIRMKSDAYKAFTEDDNFSSVISSLRKWSSPSTRTYGTSVYFEDNTGRASMENFYTTFNCTATSVKDVEDCHFKRAIFESLGTQTGWSIDWEVVVQPGMTVVSSNHTKTRHTDGKTRLVWFFDGDRDTNVSVDFVVRVPRAK